METLKKYWWVVLIAAAIIYILVLNIKVNRLSADKQLQAVELSTLKDSVLVYKSKSGELTYKLTSVEIEKGNLKESLEIAGFDIKALRAKDIEWRKITNALKVELAAAGHGQTTVTDTFRIEKTDTIYYSRVDDWTNNYLSLFNSKIEKNRLNFDYSYRTGISILQTQNRKATIVSVSLTDPNAAIVSANSITIVPKKTIWQKWWLWAAVGLTGGILIAK
jgi:hypothetical protein